MLIAFNRHDGSRKYYSSNSIAEASKIIKEKHPDIKDLSITPGHFFHVKGGSNPLIDPPMAYLLHKEGTNGKN